VLNGINTYNQFIEQLFEMVIFNEIKGKITHDCSVVLALQQQKNVLVLLLKQNFLLKLKITA
jgi:hypothetical protein